MRMLFGDPKGFKRVVQEPKPELAFAHDGDVDAFSFEICEVACAMRPNGGSNLWIGLPRDFNNALRLKSSRRGDDEQTRPIDLRSVEHAGRCRIAINGRNIVPAQCFYASPVLFDNHKRQVMGLERITDDMADTAIADNDSV